MKKIVFIVLCLTAFLIATPNMTAYAASTACSSKSFVVANWKGEMPTPPTDEAAEPVNEPEDEHSGHDAKRTAVEPEDEPEVEEGDKPGETAPPAEGYEEHEGGAKADDAAPEGEQSVNPAEQEGEQPLEDAPPPSEDAIEPEDEQSMVETEENELPAKEVTNEPAPVVDDTPKDDSENEVG